MIQNTKLRLTYARISARKAVNPAATHANMVENAKAAMFAKTNAKILNTVIHYLFLRNASASTTSSTTFQM
jgi:hypothetical protein